ncbi:MAG: hypothetical protein RLN62_02460 [Rickettsiales bacterium]
MTKLRLFCTVFLVHTIFVILSKVTISPSYGKDIDIVITPLFYLDAPVAVIWYYLRVFIILNQNMGVMYDALFTYAFFLIFGSLMWYSIFLKIFEERVTA